MNAELLELQSKGLPPPGPRSDGPDRAPRHFFISLAGAKVSKVSYSWVELGPGERTALGLDNLARTDPARNITWNEAARARGKATQLSDGAHHKLLHGALFFSRECKNQKLAAEERKQKAVDYFVLARDPEVDSAGLILPRGQAKAITGECLLQIASGKEDRWISLSFNDTGARLMQDLTERNSPSKQPPVARHLAVVVNGFVLSAPTINSPIGRGAVINGNFSPELIDILVNLPRLKR